MEDTDNKKRIPKGRFLLMLFTAITVDLLQAALGLLHAYVVIGTIANIVIGWPLYFFALAGFYVWFKLSGVRFMDRMGTRAVIVPMLSMIAEFVPILRAVWPGWTISVISIYSMVSAEDKLVEKGVISEDRLRRINELVKGYARGDVDTERMSGALRSLDAAGREKMRERIRRARRHEQGLAA